MENQCVFLWYWLSIVLCSPSLLFILRLTKFCYSYSHSLTEAISKQQTTASFFLLEHDLWRSYFFMYLFYNFQSPRNFCFRYYLRSAACVCLCVFVCVCMYVCVYVCVYVCMLQSMLTACKKKEGWCHTYLKIPSIFKKAS